MVLFTFFFMFFLVCTQQLYFLRTKWTDFCLIFPVTKLNWLLFNIPSNQMVQEAWQFFRFFLTILTVPLWLSDKVLKGLQYAHVSKDDT